MADSDRLKAMYIKAANALLEGVSSHQESTRKTLLTGPSIEDSFRELWPILSKSEPVSHFTEAMRTAESNKIEVEPRPPQTIAPAERERLLTNAIALSFMHLVSRSYGALPAPATIEEHWRGLWEEVFSEEISTCETVILTNFECEAGDVDLGSGIRIHLLTPEERQAWISQHRFLHGIDAHFAKWIMLWDYAATRREYLHGRKEPSLLDVTRMALRLLKPGGVDCRFWHQQSRYPLPSLSGTRSRGEKRPAVGGEFELLSSELKTLRSLMVTVLGQDYLNFSPAKRFDSSYHESSVPDRLADLVIALEGLLSPEGGDSITYRFALRGATLLGADLHERESLFKFLKDVYSLRSTLVHGGDMESDGRADRKVKKHAASLLELTTRVEDLVRRLLRERLMNPARFSQTALDRMLLE